MPSGWPSAMAPPLRVHVRGVVRQAELAEHRERLGGEGFVELDHVDLVDGEPPRSSSLPRRRRWARCP